jgi:Alpha/beta hydrolase family
LDHQAWAPQATALAGRYRVVVPDLRGHGESPIAGAFRFGDVVADIEALLDEIGAAAPVVLGGLSLGGNAAPQHVPTDDTVPEHVPAEDTVPGYALGCATSADTAPHDRARPDARDSRRPTVGPEAVADAKSCGIASRTASVRSVDGFTCGQSDAGVAELEARGRGCGSGW